MNLGSVPHRHDDLDITPRKALIRHYEQSVLGGIAGSIGMAGPRSVSRRHNEQGCAREAARGGTVDKGGWIREASRGNTMSRSGTSNAATFSKTVPQITSGGCREVSFARKTTLKAQKKRGAFSLCSNSRNCHPASARSAASINKRLEYHSLCVVFLP